MICALLLELFIWGLVICILGAVAAIITIFVGEGWTHW